MKFFACRILARAGPYPAAGFDVSNEGWCRPGAAPRAPWSISLLAQERWDLQAIHATFLER
jgi:hypothetical protein